MSTSITPHVKSQRTKLALLWMKVAEEPFVALYALLLFILRKDLGATALQISLFVTLRPLLSVFSFYWSANLTRRRDKLLTNLMGATFLARLPFLFLPWLDNVWYLIFASGIYQLFHRAGHPALMEILKSNMGKEGREKAFTRYFVLSFIESIFLGISFGAMLDANNSSWKILIVLSSLLGMSSIFLQRRIPLEVTRNFPIEIPTLKQRLIQPWIDSIRLLRSRPDFAHFQWGFMIGGFGLMLITPALSIYYADVLALKHTEIATARCVLMALGVTLTAPFWRGALRKLPISNLAACILAGFALFPFTLLFAQYSLFWLYFAFLLYGVAQAGSHLLWNLSGTLFAPNEDSSLFTTVNILTIGIRGAIAPILGGLLCYAFSPLPILGLGILIFLFGTIFLLKKKPKTAAI